MGVKSISKLSKKDQKYVKMLMRCENEWVALSENKQEVVAHAKTLEKLVTLVENIGDNLIFKKVLPVDVAISP